MMGAASGASLLTGCNLDRNSESRFLTALEDRDKNASEKVKALMFTFEDLAALDPSGVQTLIRQIDKKDLGVALKGASEEIRDLFFTNMSERAGKLLREEMEAMGPIRLSDVDDSQMKIVNVCKDLAAAGEVIIVETNEDDELVY